MNRKVNELLLKKNRNTMVKFYVQGHQESQCPSVPTVCPECGRKAIPRAQVSVFATHKNNCKGTKTVLDSRFQAADLGFQVLDSRQCQWSLDSEFQVLVAFRIQQANFSRSRDQKIPGFWNRDFRTWSYMGQSSIEAVVTINMHVHISLAFNFIVFV